MVNAAEFVMSKLRHAGYEAFLVGGVVRDILLQRTAKDHDITTNALPEQVSALFEHTIPVGVKFGVTVVMVDREQIEVATYRADGAYTDGRRPDTVSYGKSAREDVERRDFTMNGLLCTGKADPSSVAYYNKTAVISDRMVGVGGETYGIVDYVGGYADIQLHLIRAIGDPFQRFSEDALRMLRAVRFVAQLGFEIEGKTLEAIKEHASLLAKISRERVAQELFKLVSAPFAARGVALLYTTGLYRFAFPPEYSHTNVAMTMHRFGMFEANKDPMLGMAMFFADVPFITDRKLAEYLKLSNEQADELCLANALATAFGQHLSGSYEMTEAGLKRTCRKPGVALALELMTQDELIGKTSFGIEALMSFVLKIKAYKPEDIKPVPLIGGKDLIADGIPPGTLYTTVLYDVESLQLNGKFTTREQAMEYVRARVYQDEERHWIYVQPTVTERREKGID